MKYLLAGIALFGLASALDVSLVSGIVNRPYDVAYVPDGRMARIAAMGHRGLVSDLYWLSAVQYIGEPKADQRGWDKLLPLLEVVTDLDARHGYAYQTGGLVLGAAGRFSEARQILVKGIQKGPNWWSYPMYIAFDYWFYLGDYPNAAKWAAVAAKTPGASMNLTQLALALASKSGRPEDGLDVLRQLRATAKDEKTAQILDEQIQLGILERDAQALERLERQYEEMHGAPISTLNDLISSGLLADLPKDPYGGTYEWDPKESKVHSSANPFRFAPKDRRHKAKFDYEKPQDEVP